MSAVDISHLKIAIVGATGAVGRVALELLAARRHPAHKIKALASSRSAGWSLRYMDTELVVEETTSTSFNDVDVAFISASSAVSREFAPEVVKRGGLVIDDGSAFRMEPEVPLVVPEVNGSDVEWHSGIISIPNCTTTPMVMTLAALRRLGELRSVYVSTYQSVTGTGAAALGELMAQSRAYVNNEEPVKPSVYPRRIAFNLIPQVDDFEEDGYTVEELKMKHETRKILGEPDLPVSATCVRVPVEVSHCESVGVQLDRDVDLEKVRSEFSSFEGMLLYDGKFGGAYPTPEDSSGGDAVHVGRVRRDTSRPNGVVYWLACDNLRKGAALNALQILDECVRRECVRRG